MIRYTSLDYSVYDWPLAGHRHTTALARALWLEFALLEGVNTNSGGMAMATCPNCDHNPYGFSSSWMWIYQCNDCGKHFCHNCGTTTGDDVRCAHCDSDNTEKDYECHGDPD